MKRSPVPSVSSSSDFFEISDEDLTRLAGDGYVVFSNPPFSVQAKIVQRLRALGVPYYLVAHGLYWKTLVDLDAGDSVYYCGYIKYETPTDLRPTQRTVVIANDGKGVYKKCSFVKTYTKPYRGKKGLVFSDSPDSLDIWDTHLYAIRDYELDLTQYRFEGTRLVRA
ncbi:MAG: hypothetical protein E6R04_00375 [Spirochaetes bacterium]|nr:MAG: hypothetical protein E6R04_00375 [Spirochaetota bacterium]